MGVLVWFARDAKGTQEFYSLLTDRPVLQANGTVTSADEMAECLGVFSETDAKQIFGVELEPGECVCGTLAFTPTQAAQEMQQEIDD